MTPHNKKLCPGRPRARLVRALGAAALLLTLTAAGCGGGGGGGSLPEATASPLLTGPNVQALVVDAGPAGATSRMGNILYTSVTVCEPGGGNCKTVDHILVDTGSSGLRVLASELATLTLAPVTVNAGQPLLNCVQFLDGSYMWGAVATAEIHLSAEVAANLPIQLVQTSATSPNAPTACANGGVANDTVAGFGAKGILGLGPRVQDCGTSCTTVLTNGFYYAKAGGVAVNTVVPLAKQLQQPVSLFASNNNGVIVSLPTVPDPGAVSVHGALIFGIGTQANNQPGSPSVLTPNGNGYFSTLFNGNTLTQGFVDSGSNGWFFGISNYPTCTGGWYCPATTVALQATNTGGNALASTVDFAVSNSTVLLGNASYAAWSTLSAPIHDNVSFDFGLPFFYGRNVVTAITGKSTPLGVGPYVAY
jgi:hypothetical protein